MSRGERLADPSRRDACATAAGVALLLAGCAQAPVSPREPASATGAARAPIASAAGTPPAAGASLPAPLAQAGGSPQPAAGVPPGAAAPEAAPRRPRIAYALGGGAARGFAHVGVIAVLERSGIRPDLIVGTSAGSVVGALYASGLDARGLHTQAMRLEEAAIGDWTISARGVLRGRALQDLINRLVQGRRIERFPIPFAAVVTDLYNGALKLIREGDAGLAVRASSAVPGIFQPVSIAGREYVDGGLSSPVPVHPARALGADIVIAVDIAAKPTFQATGTLPQVLLQTFSIMGEHLAENELRSADVVIRPGVGGLASADFSNRARAMGEGERAALEALPKIRERIAAWRPA